MQKQEIDREAENKTCLNDWDQYSNHATVDEKIWFKLILSEFVKTQIEHPKIWLKDAATKNRLDAINIFNFNFGCNK